MLKCLLDLAFRPVFRLGHETRYGADERVEVRDHQFLSGAPVGHGIAGGPDRHPEPPDRGSDRALQRARKGPSFPPRSAQDGRNPPPPPRLPQEQGCGALPRIDQETRDPQIGRQRSRTTAHPQAASNRTGWHRSNLKADSGEHLKGNLASYIIPALQSSLPPAAPRASHRGRSALPSLIGGAFRKSPGARARAGTDAGCTNPVPRVRLTRTI